MKNLIIYAHPNPKSFCKAIEERAEKVFRKMGNETKIRDLYELGFQPILKPSDFEAFASGKIPEDIKSEQEYIKWADVIIFVYPIWWSGFPAILKGYIDRVFAYGFAYEYVNGVPKGLLDEKKVMIFNTTGTPNDIYANNGMHDAMKKTSDEGIFGFCNIKVLKHTFFGAVPSVDDETRKSYLNEVEKIIEENLSIC